MCRELVAVLVVCNFIKRALYLLKDSAVVVHYDHDNGEVIAPSNQFERMLQCEDIEVRSDENYKKYMYIGSITSKALVTKLETNMSVHQESIFRVLLLCRSSQVKAFDLLMTQLQILQKESRNVSDLCQICIAQIRFIDRVYYSRPLLCSIFERDILKWSPEIRNALISSIPEIITDVSIQVEAAKELQSFLLRDVETDPVGCKLAVISALLLLNSDSGAAAKMQTRVLKSLSDFDLELLPSLIELFLRRLDNSTKDAFSDLLGQLSVHLQVDQLSLSRRGKLRYSLNEIVGEVFGKITQFIVLGGEYRWRQVQKFLKTSALSEKSGADEFMSQGSDIVSSLGPPRVRNFLFCFDVSR
uniref:Integrator complex subunit 7 n=1 Tax=Angiostrongylus cantonensis TaxID=6313 RepID=A0A0K0D059_ANGCA